MANDTASPAAPSNSPQRAASPARLLHAPHRLMFFIGAGNLLLAMLWWALWLAAARWGGWSMPETTLHPGWLHAILMQYLVLPSFIFGFLLTVFPRWMHLPEPKRWQYATVGAGMLGGQSALLLGAAGWSAALNAGLWITLAGWSAALLILGRLLVADTARTWHARSCFAGLLLGWLGLAMFIAFARLDAPVAWARASIELGSFGLLLPIYLTVAHRMLPFFAGNVVPGYQVWRPLPWLAAIWALLLARLGLKFAHADAWLWLADAPLLAISAWALYRWWPRAPMPGLLATLFIGALWLPLALLLYTAQSLAELATGAPILGRAPVHALFIGFFGSVLVAMVTRVTQGHSGRTLTMPKAAWFAFIALQAVASTRILAELTSDPIAWQAAAAFGWLLALAPWVARIARISLSPRIDGRPG